MPQLDAQYRALQALHTIVVTAQIVIVAARFAPASQEPNGLGVVGIRSDDGAAFSVSAKILARVETKARELRKGSGALALVLGAMSLSCVFDDGDSAGTGDIQDRFHVGGLAVEMDRDDRFGPGCDGRLQFAGIEIVGFGIDISIDGRSAGI